VLGRPLIFLRGFGACAAILSALTGAGPAFAYRSLAETPETPQATPIVWRSSSVTLEVPATGTGPLDESRLGGALADAISEWRVSCSSLEFFAIESSNESAVGDGRNSIDWISNGWQARGLPSHAPAATELVFERLSDGNLAIAEADIHLNAEQFQWAPQPKPGAITLLPVLAHELGHVAGLVHPCEPGGTGGVVDCASSHGFDQVLMNPEYSASRSAPSSDDAAGVCTLYPAAISGACSTDAECGEGATCRFGTCASTLLPLGSACSGSAQCASGTCSGVCVAACSSDEDCPKENVCAADVRGFNSCVPKESNRGFGESCAQAEECATGLCVLDDAGQGWCTRACSPQLVACERGWACGVVGKQSLCLPPKYRVNGGCTLKSQPRSGGADGSPLVGCALAGFLLVRRIRSHGRDHFRFTGK
jgi:hypothetical protein